MICIPLGFYSDRRAVSTDPCVCKKLADRVATRRRAELVEQPISHRALAWRLICQWLPIVRPIVGCWSDAVKTTKHLNESTRRNDKRLECLALIKRRSLIFNGVRKSRLTSLSVTCQLRFSLMPTGQKNKTKLQSVI
jgi:hypothetical protein